MFMQAERNELTECINYVSAVDTYKHMSYYRETPSTFLNFYSYISICKFVLLNDILVIIHGNTHQDAKWISSDVANSSVLIRQAAIRQINASQNCYIVDKEVIGV